MHRDQNLVVYITTPYKGINDSSTHFYSHRHAKSFGRGNFSKLLDLNIHQHKLSTEHLWIYWRYLVLCEGIFLFSPAGSAHGTDLRLTKQGFYIIQ